MKNKKAKNTLSETKSKKENRKRKPKYNKEFKPYIEICPFGIRLLAHFSLFLCLFSSLFANNIEVQNPTLTGQGAGFTYVQFDVSWENSWRTSLAPNNWDACWVFVKYKIDGGCTTTKWKHATLSATDGDHSVTTTNGVAATIKGVTGGTGVFMYRSADGSGSINWDAVKLRWNYASDGVGDACTVTIKVFAIEMVYVPQGSFYVGDGASDAGQFELETSGSPFQITGEGAITLGGGGAGSLGNNNKAGQTGPMFQDDFDDATTQTLPAAFPKGYNSFYCMKYDASQEQYMEFLNTLTGEQQIGGGYSRGSTTINYFMDGSYAGASAPDTYQRNGIKCKIAPVSGSVDGEYVCNLDNDGTYNETSSDGRYIAVSVDIVDVLSYLDWSGFRPMTELEYEKACRGTMAAVASEYAWGTTTTNTSVIYPFQNSGGDNEIAKATYSADPTLGPNYPSWGTNAYALRCGFFVTANSTRVSAGNSYYGIADLSANVKKMVVPLSSVAGRSYTGLQGNGVLTSDGFADADYWPGINDNTNHNAANSVFGGTTGCRGRATVLSKGGYWGDGAGGERRRVSRRTYQQYIYQGGGNNAWLGIRGIRTAP